MANERIPIDPMRSFDPCGLHGQFNFPYFEAFTMSAEQQIPREITHPETGARMVLVEDQTARAKKAKLTGDDIGNPEAGRRVYDSIVRKEQEAGYLYRDPATGYQHRMKPEDATAGAARSDASSSASAGAGAGGSSESAEQERERLMSRLRELDAAGSSAGR